MVDELTLKKKVADGAFAFVQDSLVFLVGGKSDAPIGNIGSGTAVRTPGGHVAILTARHVLTEPHWTAHAYAMGYSLCIGGLDDVVDDVIDGPAGVDVAVVLLKPDAAAAVSKHAIASDLVARESDREGEFWWIVAGYPFAHTYAGRSTITDRTVAQFVAPLLYGAGSVTKDQRGRYQVEWGEGQPTEDTAEHFRFLGVVAGRSEPLPSPRGISGGSLWRFGGVKKNEVWTAAKVGSLVGIPCSWLPDDRIQYAESASGWGDWFRLAVQRLDRS